MGKYNKEQKIKFTLTIVILALLFVYLSNKTIQEKNGIDEYDRKSGLEMDSLF